MLSRCLLLFVLLLPFFAPLQGSAFGAEPAKVLVLLSHAKQNRWSAEVEQGLLEGLEGQNIIITEEVLGGSRELSTAQLKLYSQLFEKRYRGQKFDLILAIDDLAYRFLKEEHTPVFHSTPTIFIGVNGFQNEDLTNHPNWSGLILDYQFEKQIPWVEHHNSNLREVLVILDESIASQARGDAFQDKLLLLEPKAFYTFSTPALSALKEELQGLPKGRSAIIWLTQPATVNAIREQWPDLLALSKEQQTPFYSPYTFSHQQFSVGGQGFEPYFVGQEAGRLALTFLQEGVLPPVEIYRGKPWIVSDLADEYDLNVSRLKSDEWSAHPSSIWVAILTRGPWLALLVLLVWIFAYLRKLKNDYQQSTKRFESELAERIEAEKALYANEQKVRDFLEFSPVGICVVNSDGIFEYVNSAFCDLFLYDSEELLGYGIWEYFPMDLSFFIPKSTSGSIMHEGTLLNRKGEKLTLLSESNLIFSGNEAQHVVFVIDITKRKQTENELVEAQQKAEAASKTKEEFLAMISHEIRTPLNSVMGMTSILERTTLTDEQKELLTNIQSGGETLLIIINDILDLSKVSQGKLSLEEEPLELIACIEECIDLFSIQAEGKSLLITYQIDRDVPDYINSDITRIRQILVNLIGNAVKFTPKGNIHVHVQRVYDESENIILQFSVEDQGIGISKELQPQLFEAFSQADISTTRKYGGSGLGLAICKHLVELMGGTIWVTSEDKKGSIFYFTLQVTAATEEKKGYHETFLPALQGKNILMVVSHPRLQQVLSVILKKWGAVPLSFSVFEVLRLEHFDRQFDAVLLENPPHGLDPKDVIAELRSRLDDLQTPFLFLDALTSKMRGKKDLGDAVLPLSIPLHQQQLHFLLHKALGVDLQSMNDSDHDLILPVEISQKFPLKILITDDNLLNLNVMQRLLHLQGYHADQVMNGQEAVDACRRTQYDLVFLDIQMPVMDGVEANRQIQEICPKTHSIAVTAHAMQGTKEEYLQVGFNGYLSKPVRLENIYTCLCAWLEVIYPEADFSDEGIFQIPAQEGEASLQGPALELLDSELFDHALVESRLSLGLSFLQSGIEEFKNTHEKTINQIQKAIAQQDVLLVQEALHSFKGVSANLGAIGMVGLLSNLEKQADSFLDKKIAEEKFNEILQIFEKSFVQFKSLLKSETEKKDEH